MLPEQPVKLGFRQKLENREKECFRVLNRLSPERSYVLIGGYAVSSFHFPRYSVDLDIVVPEEEVGFFQGLAKSLGYVPSSGKEEVDPVYGGRSEGFVKDIGVVVGIDLLVNSVQSRDTGSAYSFRHIAANSETREIRGRGLEARATVRVADKEMLIALKAQPMREQDIGDILALCYESPNESKLAAHLQKCPKQRILENLAKLGSYLENPKTDSVRGAFSFGQHEFDQCLKNCKRLLSGLQGTLQQSTA